MITLHHEDIPADLDFGNSVAVDSEWMGLNLYRDRLCLIQLSAGDGTVHMVKFASDRYNAPNLCRLLADPKVQKIFHVAVGDMAVFKHRLGVLCQNVYCTKIASRLCRTYSDRNSMKEILKEQLGIDLQKAQTCSDWGAPNLTQAQLEYAADDVLYLHKMRDALNVMLDREGRREMAEKCFAFIPARTELYLLGWNETDIFLY